ncbi:hypothetical protein [Seongchinamella unica]|nr:hypothetical protein [Seongchinamella unica]
MAKDIQAPKGADGIEGNVKTIMPGMIDVHWLDAGVFDSWRILGF